MSFVHYADARARRSSDSLLEKLGRLITKSELPTIISPGDRVLIKCHMAAPLTTRYLRPVYVRRVVDEVKALGGKPVIVETTGLGLLDPRGTATKYLKVATKHGYTPEVLGAPILIADGDCGLDAFRVEAHGLNLREVSLAGALKGADVLIGLAHFKGHALVAVGGAVKNIAIGLSSKEGKFTFHYEAKPKVDKGLCNSCGDCLEICPAAGAVRKQNGKVTIDPDICVGCLACVVKCKAKALAVKRRSDPSVLQSMMADMASAVVNTVGRENVFFVNFILEVDWQCDCEHGDQGWSDVPIVPDVGVMASTDPVALDVASTDSVNDALGIPGSKADEVGALQRGADKFKAIYPNIDWKEALMACERLGIGRTAYKLMRVE
jgi:uncharacterized Fe-S center protein